uniref:Uncharacterized protein n=1 Tax=Glossina brevipalpis TaxID=37001 RepID=A0A1A9WPQ3_9MUSC
MKNTIFLFFRPRLMNKKFFRSSQNAALLQYRLPTKGSFIANVRFHKITQPCNVLVHDISALYNMANYGFKRNCSVSALFPAVIQLAHVKIGSKAVRKGKVSYEVKKLNLKKKIQAKKIELKKKKFKKNKFKKKKFKKKKNQKKKF